MATTDDLRKELDKLKADMARLRSDTSEVTRTLREVGGDELRGLGESAENELQRRRQRMRRGMEAGRERSRRAMEEMEDEVGAHPFASIFAALGVGFILAKLLDIATRR